VPRRITRCSAVALTVFAFGAASYAPAATPTTAAVYRAFSARGRIVPHIRVQSGYCWSASDVTPRDDAWRCLVGNLILDPCFSSALASGVVVCPTPWNDTGTEIRLTKALPKLLTHTAPSGALAPWAIETAPRADCLLSSGASSVLQGRRLNYFCGAKAKYGLWGFPDRASQPWTIFSAPLRATKLSARVAISRAWM
jgi:hypothetical protein